MFIEWFLSTRWYEIFLVLVYITSLILCSNKNLNISTINTLILLDEMIVGWMDILWRYTETCKWIFFFNPQYCLKNSTLFPQIKITKAVRYINDNKSWESCYVILNIIFTCLSVHSLEYSNHAGMDKVYYFLRMTKQCIEKTIFDIYYKKLFPDINLTVIIWNMSDDEIG